MEEDAKIKYSLKWNLKKFHEDEKGRINFKESISSTMLRKGLFYDKKHKELIPNQASMYTSQPELPDPVKDVDFVAEKTLKLVR